TRSPGRPLPLPDTSRVVLSRFVCSHPIPARPRGPLPDPLLRAEFVYRRATTGDIPWFPRPAARRKLAEEPRQAPRKAGILRRALDRRRKRDDRRLEKIFPISMFPPN